MDTPGGAENAAAAQGPQKNCEDIVNSYMRV